MALGTMHYGRETVTTAPEILFNSEYVGRAITLDTTAFSDGICKAGTPVGGSGTVDNTATALGVLLYDVYEERPQGTVVIGGYIKAAVAEAHSGVTVEDAARNAMKNVVFCE